MKKKPRQAIALAYNSEDDAPKIVAAGKGVAAENIVSAAQDNDVPVHEDAQLAQSLGLFAVGEEIPPELYGVVAQILIFVSDMDHDIVQWESRTEQDPDSSLAESLGHKF